MWGYYSFHKPNSNLHAVKHTMHVSRRGLILMPYIREKKKSSLKTILTRHNVMFWNMFFPENKIRFFRSTRVKCIMHVIFFDFLKSDSINRNRTCLFIFSSLSLTVSSLIFNFQPLINFFNRLTLLGCLALWEL